MSSGADDVPSVHVLGVRVHTVQMPEVLKQIEHWIEERDKCRYIVATGMHGVMESRRDPAFKEIVNSADLFIPDGMAVVWAARRRGVRSARRVCGSDLMWEFFKIAEQKGFKIFFYGDTENTLRNLTGRLNELFPKLKIVGTHSPPFRTLTPEEDTQEVAMINESGADVIWVGLGLPKQERWMFEHKDRLSVPVIVGVGAAFKFASGQVQRAPRWVGDRGFEWLWRFVREPRRVWRRVLLDGPSFTCQIMLELGGLKKYN